MKCALVAAALLLAAVSAAAQDAATLARSACTAVAAPVAAAAAEDFEELLRADPPRALALACARLAGETSPDAALAVAEALLVNGQLDAAQRLFDSLQAEAPPADAAGARPAWVARLLIGQATLAHERGGAAASATLFEQAEQALRASGSTRGRAFAAARIGRAAGWLARRQTGDIERAEAALDEAGALLAEIGLADSRQMGDVLNFRSIAAHARQDLDAAVRWARAEIALMARLGHGDDPELLHAYTTVGALLSQLGRFDEAEAAFRDGLRIMDAFPDAEPAGQLGILANLAALHQDRGDAAAALPVAERAVALARRIYGENSPRSVTPLTARAIAERNLAWYARARRSFEDALAIAAEHAASVGPLRRLRLYESYAAVLQALGDGEAARAALDTAQRIADAGDASLGYWHGRILRSSAKLAARSGDWAGADARHADASRLIGAVIGPRHPYVVAMLAERCIAQVRGALAGEACAELPERLADLDAAAAHHRFIAQAALAIAAESQGRWAEARERHLLALAAATSVGGPDPLWSAYDAFAVHLRAAGERQMAIVAAKQAVEQVEAMRRDFGADARRLERGFLADKLGVYRRLADWLTEDGRVDEALDVLRLLKQEEFHDFVRGPAAAADLPGAMRLRTPRDARLIDRWEQLGEAPTGGTAAAEPRTPAEVETQRRLFQRQAEAEAARVAAWRDFLASNSQSVPAAGSTAVPGMAAAAALRPGELRVFAYPAEAHVNLVLDAPGRREVHRVEIDAPALARAVGRLLGDIGRRAPVDEQLQSLYTTLGVPIDQAARRAGARRIVLHLDGVLRYLPFAALHDGRRYLGERYAIEQRVDSVARTGPAAATRISQPATLRAVGVTRALGGLAPLAGLAREVCGIVDGPVLGLDAADAACAAAGRGRGVVRGAAWLNERFTAERLTQLAAQGRAGQRDLLHVGTHFVLRPGNMTRSWLLLGDGRRLYVNELAEVDFAGQDLVTLSACETGIGGGSSGEDASGQELDGLNALVMRRGAAAVLASLWRVEDASTGALMVALYRELARQADPAVALGRAQAAVRDAGAERSHPFFWAGFYLASGGS